MQRRGDDLRGGGGGELHDRLAADVPLDLGAHDRRHGGAQQHGDVEARKDGHAVAGREERVAGRRDAADGLADGAEHACVHLVLVDAQADVGRGGGGELGSARGDVRGGLVLPCRGCGVEPVGGQVGAAVDGEDERNRLGEEHCVRAQEKAAQGVLDRDAERGAAGGVLHDRAGVCQRLVWSVVTGSPRSGTEGSFVFLLFLLFFYLPINDGYQRGNERSRCRSACDVCCEPRSEVLGVPFRLDLGGVFPLELRFGQLDARVVVFQLELGDRILRFAIALISHDGNLRQTTNSDLHCASTTQERSRKGHRKGPERRGEEKFGCAR